MAEDRLGIWGQKLGVQMSEKTRQSDCGRIWLKAVIRMVCSRHLEQQWSEWKLCVFMTTVAATDS